VREFEGSGQTHNGFCLSRRLDVGTFRRWLYRLRREGSSRRKGPVLQFLPLVPSSTSSGPVRVRVGEVELSFAELPTATYLAELLRLMDR
jgi:hypothetical protein